MMTARERATLVFIVGYQRDSGGVSPSLRQIGQAIGQKAQGKIALNLVRGLEVRGFIRRLKGRARAIEVLATDVEMFKFDDEAKELRPVPS